MPHTGIEAKLSRRQAGVRDGRRNGLAGPILGHDDRLSAAAVLAAGAAAMGREVNVFL